MAEGDNILGNLKKRRSTGLGRGLSALLEDEAAADSAPARSGSREVPIEKLKPNVLQPRTLSKPEALAELAELVDLSQFHFGRLFKQSVGRSPYQYLLQQRVIQKTQSWCLEHSSPGQICFV